MSDESKASFEQSIVTELAKQVLYEQRRSRRWGIFFKLLFALYLAGFLLFYITVNSKLKLSTSVGGHTALIEINGVISAETEASADYIVTALRKAFKDNNTKGVIVRINSPGGSPVQAGYINDEIKHLKQKYPTIPLHVVITDICASGGYYIAAAADNIYANKASIVGSIGVLMNSFGFVDAIAKLGIERRLFHAGASKGLLDPFQPLKPVEQQHIQGLLDEIHQQFISVVRDGRGERLADDEQIFSGLIWSGEESIKLGLVDGLASASEVARDIIGAEDIVDFTEQEDYLQQFARDIGVTIVNNLHKTFTLK